MDDLSCSWIVYHYYCEAVHHTKNFRFYATLFKIPKQFFLEIENIILNFIWKYKKQKVKQNKKAKKPINNKKAVEDITMPYFKLCYEL